MESALNSAASFEDLLAANVTHPHYDFTSIFQPEGMLGKRREKQRLATLRKLDEKITAILDEGETVRMVSRGLEKSLREQMFFGWIMYYMNLTAFVLTDRRLLLLQISSRGKPKHFIKQYPLDAIRAAKFSFGGSLKVTDGVGKVTAFARMPGKDGKRLAALLQESIQAQDGKFTFVAKQSLCPTCYHIVEGRPRACENCQQQFATRGKAAMLSLAFPGLGDIYLKHYGFATVEIIGVGVLWTARLLGRMSPTDGSLPMSFPQALLTSAIVMVPFIHLPDAIMTWLIAGKGLVPVGGKPANEASLQADNMPKAHEWKG